jgi:hypothetical protein
MHTRSACPSHMERTEVTISTTVGAVVVFFRECEVFYIHLRARKPVGRSSLQSASFEFPVWQRYQGWPQKDLKSRETTSPSEKKTPRSTLYDVKGDY